MSCLFDSLLSASHIDNSNSKSLRLDLVQFVWQHAETYKEHIAFANNGESVEQYCRRMSKENEQGDYIMVCAFVHMYQRELHLKMPSGAVHIIKSFPDTLKPPVTICWQPGHYFI